MGDGKRERERQRLKEREREKESGEKERDRGICVRGKERNEKCEAVCGRERIKTQEF